jgi:hypothetical protein
MVGQRYRMHDVPIAQRTVARSASVPPAANYMASIALTFSDSISLPGPAFTTSPRDITT